MDNPRWIELFKRKIKRIEKKYEAKLQIFVHEMKKYQEQIEIRIEKLQARTIQYEENITRLEQRIEQLEHTLQHVNTLDTNEPHIECSSPRQLPFTYEIIPHPLNHKHSQPKWLIRKIFKRP